MVYVFRCPPGPRPAGRQEEEWDRKVVLKTVDAEDSAAAAAAAQSAAVEAVRSIAASKVCMCVCERVCLCVSEVGSRMAGSGTAHACQGSRHLPGCMHHPRSMCRCTVGL